ncbi:MAG: type II toxin-antitoxin system HicB family antitoxin [Candidatus Tectomicrobia bacterium]|nr:type II toxin-antitoxin system HicB family antitoxin [Candidatus Tectomicrobia bacterium]
MRFFVGRKGKKGRSDSTAKDKGSGVNSHIFKVVIEEDRFEDGRKAYHASCPALRGCHTWGYTAEEALANIREAVELYVDDLRAAGAR